MFREDMTGHNNAVHQSEILMC